VTIKRVEATYSGRVQGVGFRFTAEELAIKYGIKGYVRNMPDGGVEVVGEGEEATLKLFLDDIDAAMGHYVGKKTINWLDSVGGYKSFRIEY
jgi:acylphosphatase